MDAMFAQHLASAFADGESPLRHIVLIGEGDVPHDIKYEDLLAAGSTDVPEEPEEDDPVVLMYTGGTTGLPKGVLLDQRAEMLNLYHVAAVQSFDPRRCTCTRRRCSTPPRWRASWASPRRAPPT